MPLYQQLADVLRQDITEGRLPAGVAFPSERKLMARHQVTRTTVRSAIGVLKQEGLVVAEHGAGSFVRDPKADRRRVEASTVGMARPGPPKGAEFPGTPAGREVGSGATLGTAELRMHVTPWMAELLNVVEGTQVLLQEAVGLDRAGIPSIFRAWLSPRAEEDLGLTEMDLAGNWLPDVMALKGILGMDGEDVVEAAMPTPDVKQKLALPEGVPVLHLYRVMREKDEVVAVVETQQSADMTTLVFPRVPPSF